MTAVETIVALAGAIGLAEILRLIISKFYSKKQDHLEEKKSEFSVLKERLEYTERELNRLNKNQIDSSRKISKLYSFVADMTKETCTKKNCKLREIMTVNFDEIDAIDEPTNEIQQE